jgi:hypothetical protein
VFLEYPSNTKSETGLPPRLADLNGHVFPAIMCRTQVTAVISGTCVVPNALPGWGLSGASSEDDRCN